MLNILQDHDVFTSLQSSLIPGEFTVNQLGYIYNTFCKALDDYKKVHAGFFCDESKAFDRVWHKGLIYKLQTVGITGSVTQDNISSAHDTVSKCLFPKDTDIKQKCAPMKVT